MSYQIEVTDTFGGDANYCWVKRETIKPDDIPKAKPDDNARADQKRIDRYIIRRAKAFAGWAGLRCKTDDCGDLITIRPRGIHQVCFITWQDD